MRFLLTLITAAILNHAVASVSCAADWKPAAGPLMTRWAKEVTPDNVHPEYPRPQMVRKDWMNLNGLWQYAVRPREEGKPATWDGQILVPFPIESALSGVMKPVSEKQKLWYRRTFRMSLEDGLKFSGSKPPEKLPPLPFRVLLNFGAVDWEAEVWVNGKGVGGHRGGYTPFTLDITDALKRDGEQELVVAVWDPTDAGTQPRGKQIRRPEGIWYTAVTGIWQTVWLERVEPTHFRAIRIVPDIDQGKALITVELNPQKHKEGTSGEEYYFSVALGSRHMERPWKRFPEQHELKARVGETLALPIDNPRLWSPDDPYLYSIQVSIRAESKGRGPGGKDTKFVAIMDPVISYFAMRKIEVRKDDAGHNRLFLNNKPVFQYGPLDQGWWPDGLYTAPTDAALAYDIEITKKLGMNMCRKHVKVEPARWYYHCDRLGLLVWQDMPNGDRHIGPRDRDITRSAESEANYRREWREIMDFAGQFPCVVAWVPFNEGWGQFKTNEILAWTKKHDPTRLVDGPSGWTDRGGESGWPGDMHDMHMYPGPGMFPVSQQRASVLGEFGGLGLPMEKHLWWNKRNWGYRTYKTQEELQTNYETLIRNLRPLIARGLAAAVYTQTTDVEGEVNGLMTYDRAVIKLDAERVAALHKRLYEPPPIIEVKTLVATSETEAQTWRYTTARPGDGWNKPDFDDSAWQEGPGGFGTKETPGTSVRTTWNTRELWLRRTIEVPAGEHLSRWQLRVHHDEDAEVYVNGTRVATLAGYTTSYREVDLDPKVRSALRPGKNVLAIHCRQTSGGQYIDAGIIDVIEKPR